MTNQKHFKLLKSDRETWNNWRREFKDKNLRFSHLDLKEINLEGYDLEKVIFDYCDLSGANLNSCNLRNTAFCSSELQYVTFRGANLNNGELSIPPRETLFVDVNLNYSDFRNTDIKNVTLSKSLAQHCNFSNLKFKLFRVLDTSLAHGNFTNSDLSKTMTMFVNADFSYANLEGVNFVNEEKYGISEYKVDFSRCDFSHANLNSSRLWNIRLTSSMGKARFSETNLSHIDFRTSDLSGYDFMNCIFAKSNLFQVNLKNSNLSNCDFCDALLLETNLLSANVSNSNFTGACIADWNINNSTNFDGATCEYIYLKWDEENKRPFDRRPSNLERKFSNGEFLKLIRKIPETVDLIFSEGVDWQAFLASYQDIRCENKYGELDIRAIEKSSDGSLVIRVEVPEETNKAELESQFYERYEVKLKQLESFYQQQLQAKDTEIESYRRESANMAEIAKLLASKPITVEAKAVAEGNVQQSGNFGIGVNQGKVQEGAIVAGIYNESPKRDLRTITQEIQTLLEKLSGQHNDNKDLLALKLSELQKNLIEISAKLES